MLNITKQAAEKKQQQNSPTVTDLQQTTAETFAPRTTSTNTIMTEESIKVTTPLQNKSEIIDLTEAPTTRSFSYADGDNDYHYHFQDFRHHSIAERGSFDDDDDDDDDVFGDEQDDEDAFRLICCGAGTNIKDASAGNIKDLHLDEKEEDEINLDEDLSDWNESQDAEDDNEAPEEIPIIKETIIVDDLENGDDEEEEQEEEEQEEDEDLWIKSEEENEVEGNENELEENDEGDSILCDNEYASSAYDEDNDAINLTHPISPSDSERLLAFKLNLQRLEEQHHERMKKLRAHYMDMHREEIKAKKEKMRQETEKQRHWHCHGYTEHIHDKADSQDESAESEEDKVDEDKADSDWDSRKRKRYTRLLNFLSSADDELAIVDSSQEEEEEEEEEAGSVFLEDDDDEGNKRKRIRLETPEEKKLWLKRGSEIISAGIVGAVMGALGTFYGLWRLGKGNST